MVDPWPSGGLAPRRDGCGRVHGLAALFEDAAAAPVVGSAQVFNTLRLGEALVDVYSPHEFEEGMAVTLIEWAVDGLLDKPEDERDEIVAVIGAGHDVAGAVDTGDVASCRVPWDLLRENRYSAAFDAAAAAVKMARLSSRSSFGSG